MNDRTLLFVRSKILVMIEKELIAHCHEQALRLTKRVMEKRTVANHDRFRYILQTDIREVFVDWDFNKDIGIIVLHLHPKLF